ncbi:hypothetical protein ASF62_11080 [Leifsonia sp. Leaf325]|nr:hypothetical protein [Leifsonia sp. Leaf325]KQQ94604.1 hypothetical protein ASF62_11080 [Leifsonia sp. Leaf325]
MISLEGAGLLAQVIPVGLLIIVIERRLVTRLLPTGRFASMTMWAGRVAMILAVLLGAFAVERCIVAVSSGEIPRGIDAAIIGLGAYLVWITTGILFFLFFLDTPWAEGLLAAQSQKRALRNPEETAKRLAYIKKTNPDLFNHE